MTAPLANRAICVVKGHEWRYFDDRENVPNYTGYLEKCERCGQIRQIPQ